MTMDEILSLIMNPKRLEKMAAQEIEELKQKFISLVLNSEDRLVM